MRAYVSQKTTWIHIKCIDSEGLDRLYFTKKNCLGSKFLHSVGWEDARHTNYTGIKVALEKLYQDETVEGIDERAKDFLAIKRSAANLTKKVEKKEGVGGTLANIVELEYLEALGKGHISPAKFAANYYKKQEYSKALTTLRNLDFLKKQKKWFKSNINDDKRKESMIETLLRYCEKHKRPKGNFKDLAEEYDLTKPFNEILRTFILRGKTKKFCYWHYGAPNTGKTKNAKLIKEIFYCQTLEYVSGGWSVVSDPPEV